MRVSCASRALARRKYSISMARWDILMACWGGVLRRSEANASEFTVGKLGAFLCVDINILGPEGLWGDPLQRTNSHSVVFCNASLILVHL